MENGQMLHETREMIILQCSRSRVSVISLFLSSWIQ